MPLTQPLTRPLTSSAARRVEEGGASGARAAFIRSLAIIGDSRTEQGIKQFYSASSADWKGLDIPSAFTSPGITSTASPGTLEYRAADGYLRWTAPGDTAGAWTPGLAGIVRCESGTADKYIDLRIATWATRPGTDQTISVTFAGDLRFGWHARGFWKRALDHLRWLNTTPKVVGIGGNTTADVLEQLSYIQTQATGPGWDIVWLGTNDIGGRIASATTTANLQTILDARRALGRTLCIVNEHARWDNAINTPMDAGQQAAHATVNAFLAQYATDHGCVFVDAYSLTVDNGFSDRRPAAGYVIDNVHLTDKGAQVIGAAIASAIAARTGYGNQRSAVGNLLANGDFSGAGGTPSTGTSGTVATNWLTLREAGDAAATCSVIARTDGVTGNWQRIQFSGTTAGRIMARTNPELSFASMGLAPGDSIYFEIEVDARSLANVTNVQSFVQWTGATSPSLVSTSVKQASGVASLVDGAYVLRSPVFTIPTTATALQLRTWIEHDVNASGDVRLGAAAIVKV